MGALPREHLQFFRQGSPMGTYPYSLSSFCIASQGRDGKELVRHFNPLPQTANYFTNISDIFYETREPLIPSWDHIIIDNADRLPFHLLENYCPSELIQELSTSFENLKREKTTFRLSQRHFWEQEANGEAYGLTQESLDFMRTSLQQSFYAKQVAFDKIRNFLKQDTRAFRLIKNVIDDAIDLALKKVKWNFKTAIPQYFPTFNRMCLLLPLAIVSENKIDVALVAEKMPSRNYLGQTILPLDWAYSNARLICRPDSDWLSPDSVTSEESVVEDIE